jgi:hypothetical protein
MNIEPFKTVALSLVLLLACKGFAQKDTVFEFKFDNRITKVLGGRVAIVKWTEYLDREATSVYHVNTENRNDDSFIVIVNNANVVPLSSVVARFRVISVDSLGKKKVRNELNNDSSTIYSMAIKMECALKNSIDTIGYFFECSSFLDGTLKEKLEKNSAYLSDKTGNGYYYLEISQFVPKEQEPDLGYSFLYMKFLKSRKNNK